MHLQDTPLPQPDQSLPGQDDRGGDEGGGESGGAGGAGVPCEGPEGRPHGLPVRVLQSSPQAGQCQQVGALQVRHSSTGSIPSLICSDTTASTTTRTN